MGEHGFGDGARFARDLEAAYEVLLTRAIGIDRDKTSS